MKKSQKRVLRRMRNGICILITAAASWNYLVSYGVIASPFAPEGRGEPEYTEIVLPEKSAAEEAGAPAAGQEGFSGEALPTPEILSWVIWDVPHIYQYDTYPTGCESVSAVCALRYSGADISVDDFIDKYLVRGNLGEKPGEVWWGRAWTKRLSETPGRPMAAAATRP